MNATSMLKNDLYDLNKRLRKQYGVELNKIVYNKERNFFGRIISVNSFYHPTTMRVRWNVPKHVSIYQVFSLKECSSSDGVCVSTHSLKDDAGINPLPTITDTIYYTLLLDLSEYNRSQLTKKHH